MEEALVVLGEVTLRQGCVRNFKLKLGPWKKRLVKIYEFQDTILNASTTELYFCTARIMRFEKNCPNHTHSSFRDQAKARTEVLPSMSTLAKIRGRLIKLCTTILTFNLSMPIAARLLQ
jgi:hypothetical protein